MRQKKYELVGSEYAYEGEYVEVVIHSGSLAECKRIYRNCMQWEWGGEYKDLDIVEIEPSDVDNG